MKNTNSDLGPELELLNTETLATVVGGVVGGDIQEPTNKPVKDGQKVAGTYTRILNAVFGNHP